MDKRTIFGIIAAVFAALAGILGVQLIGEEGGGGEPGPIPTFQNQDPEFWYDIYFTNPTCGPEEERVNGVDEIMATDLRQATGRVDIAIFDLDSVPIIDALIALEQDGIEVRIVVDDEHTPESTINRLRRNGITVVGDDRTTLMHNKFIIIDGQIVWMGSMNFSTNGVFCNNNNIVRMNSPRLAANYTAEFEEMYNDRQFGVRSPENTVSRLTTSGVDLENYFASEDDLAPIIGRVIARANSEVLFMAFAFTSDDIGETVLERAESGLNIRGVVENVGAENRYSYFPDLRDSGLPNVEVRKDGNRRIMHHKVIIVDRSIVIFGSYNFTDSADDSNDENILIVKDEEFASYFVEEFETVWQEAAPSE